MQQIEEIRPDKECFWRRRRGGRKREGDGVRKGRTPLERGTPGLPPAAKYIRSDGERPDHR